MSKVLNGYIEALNGLPLAASDKQTIARGLSMGDQAYAAQNDQGPKPLITNTITESKTLVVEDANTYNRIVSEEDVVVTIPTNASVSIPINSVVEFFQVLEGALEINAADGVNIVSYDNIIRTGGIGTAAIIKKVGTDTWDLVI